MATIKDVAARAGVSISTVSYALNNHPNIKPDTKAKILKAAKELNYHANGNARNLKKQKTGNVGVFIYGFAGPIFSDVLEGIHQKLQESGLNIIVSSGNSGLNLLLERQVDAAVVFDDHLKDEDLIHYASTGSPVYVLDRALSGENIYSSVIQNDKLVYDFITKQIDKGYHNFGYISGPKESYNNTHRFNGFEEALKNKNLPHHYYQGDFTIHGGYQWGLEIAEKKEKPDFIYCANDELAIGLIQALTSKGITVPNEIAVAGFDNITLGNYIHPSLTTIGIDHFKWGKEVAESIANLLKNCPVEELQEPIGHIIKRESC